MKFKILAILQWASALFFTTIILAAIVKGNIPIPEGEKDIFLVGWFVGLGSGFLMAAIAIYVLFNLGVKNWKK